MEELSISILYVGNATVLSMKKNKKITDFPLRKSVACNDHMEIHLNNSASEKARVNTTPHS